MSFQLGFSSTDTDTTGSQEQTTTANKTGTQTTTGTTTGKQQQNVATLSPEIMALLEKALGGMLAGPGVTGDLTKFAQGGTDFFSGMMDTIGADLRQQTQRKLGETMTGLASAAGSTQNSLMAALQNQLGTEAETSIASTMGQIGTQLRGAQLGELTSAAGAEQAQTGQLLQALKGGLTSGTTDTTTQQNQTVQMQEQLNQLVKMLTQQSQESSGFNFGFA